MVGITDQLASHIIADFLSDNIMYKNIGAIRQPSITDFIELITLKMTYSVIRNIFTSVKLNVDN